MSRRNLLKGFAALPIAELLIPKSKYPKLSGFELQSIPIRHLCYNDWRRKRIPREYDDMLDKSIREDGLVNLITVVRRIVNGDDWYMIVSGVRRVASVSRLGWDSIPCYIAKGIKGTFQYNTMSCIYD